jgi:prepilin-type N-terminal cleavage/methylation domain-containing protein
MRISVRSSQSVLETVTPSSKRHQGFVLVEVIVAMVLLAVAVSSLAALVFSVSHSGIRITGDAYRNGVLMNEVNRLEGIPYASIVSSDTTISTGPYQHRRIVTVNEVALNLIKSVKVVIKPTNLSYKPDSISFVRTNARTTKVLCTDCPNGVDQQ